MVAPLTFADFRTLSVAQRIELMGNIWDSLIEDGWRPPLTDDLKAELDRRVAEHRNDPDTAIPREDVKRAARGDR